VRERLMKKVTLENNEEDDLCPEYDLGDLLKDGVRGKYAERYRAGVNLVRLDADVARAFPTEEAVNEALRLVMKMAELPARESH
jgi:hypothetical protein